MLKLKYLFDNRDLALMLLKNWNYDPDSLDLMDQYRISANAVYPFKYQNQVYLLRFASCNEKSKKDWIAEIDFIQYLLSHNFPALKPIPTKKDELIVEKETPWGSYLAIVTKKVPGKRMSDLEITPEMINLMGKTLGRLHKLSLQYKPGDFQRTNCRKILKKCEDTLRKMNSFDNILSEFYRLRPTIDLLSKDDENYCLIHYDFELDNLFYDESNNMIYVIDFDDSMYHLTYMDIQQSLESIKEAVREESFLSYKEEFLNGYNEYYKFTSDQYDFLKIMKKFSLLYKYARIAIAVDEKWDNEPEWLFDLRIKLNKLQKSLT